MPATAVRPSVQSTPLAKAGDGTTAGARRQTIATAARPTVGTGAAGRPTGTASAATHPTGATGAAVPRRPGPSRSGGASHNRRFSNRRAGGAKPSSSGSPSASDDHEILFQKFFKSVGPRTYAAQVKRAKNRNHYLVLMEGKRDEATGDVRKTRLFIYSEDFVEFFRLIKSAAEFIKQNPIPNDVREKREKFWAKQGGNGNPAAGPRVTGGGGGTTAFRA
jgi:hypothetical protein